MKDNGFKLAKETSRRYPAQKTRTTDANYADDIAFLANTPAQAENLVHSLEWAAGGRASMSKHTRRNTCALIKEATSPH